MNEIDRPEEYATLTQKEKKRLLAWISRCFEPALAPSRYTSYGMKHWFEREADLYVTHGSFKGAMLAAGFEPVDTSELNWEFRCRWNSPCAATTTAGTPCKRRGIPGQRHCRVHHYR